MIENKNIGISLIKLACCWLVVFSYMPFIRYYVTFPISALPLILITLGVMFTGNYDRIGGFFIIFLFIVFYAFLLYLSVWKELTDITSKIWGVIVFWMSVLLTISLKGYKSPLFYKRILYLLFLVILLTCITTIIGLNKVPMASRFLATGRYDLYDLDIYIRKNIGGYGFIYSLVLLIPCLIYIIRKKLINRFVMLIFLALCYYCIFKSQYSIAIVTSFAFIPLCFMKINKGKLIYILIFSAFLLLLLKNIIGDLLIFIADKIDYNFIELRFYQLASILQGTNIDGSDDRLILYMMSIKAFLGSPILGRLSFIFEQLPIGRHSEFLDLLGATGLFGFSIFAMIFGFSYKYIFKNNKQAKNNILFQSTFLAFFLLGSINTIQLPMMFPLFFVWYCIFSLEEKEVLHESIMAV